MKHTKADGIDWEAGDDARFGGGDVRLYSGPSADDGGHGVVVVEFDPGSRTHWHSHAGGQFLYGATGSGRTQSLGEPVAVIQPGDVIYVAPGEQHWHGASPAEAFTHFAANLGGAVDWGVPVTDEEYGGA